jgi:cytochrome d ubiquinol oxidase subunit I
MIAITLFAAFNLWRGKLYQMKWLLWIFVFAVLLPQIANQAGWFAAEMGRQPWVVYGLLRTSDALSQSVTANQVLFSLIMFAVIYTLLFILFIYLLNKKIQNGPYQEKMIDQRPGQEEMLETIGLKKN